MLIKDTHREKNHRQLKLQPLQKVQIWAFGLLLQKVNSV